MMNDRMNPDVFGVMSPPSPSTSVCLRKFTPRARRSRMLAAQDVVA